MSDFLRQLPPSLKNCNNTGYALGSQMVISGSGNPVEGSWKQVATLFGSRSWINWLMATSSSIGISQATTNHAELGSYRNADNTPPYGPRLRNVSVSIA